MWTGESFSCTFFDFTPTPTDSGIRLMDVVTEAFEVAVSVNSCCRILDFRARNLMRLALPATQTDLLYKLLSLTVNTKLCILVENSDSFKKSRATCQPYPGVCCIWLLCPNVFMTKE